MKILAPFVLILAALMTVVYLDDAPERADVVFVDAAEIFTLDPQRMSWTQDFRMAYALYEGLVRWDNSDFTIEPAAATWTVSDDQLIYTFNIRADAKWSNGDPLTAHDFVYAWRRAILPDTAADYTALFFAITGAEEFFQWRTQKLKEFAQSSSDLDAQAKVSAAQTLWRETEEHFSQTVGFEIVDDRTLRIHLIRPVAYFLDLVAFGVFYPVHRPTVEGWNVDEPTKAQMRLSGWTNIDEPNFADRAFVNLNPTTGRIEQQHGWTKPDRFVGNGPYVPTHWRYKRGLRIGRNPHYHSPERVSSDSVETVSINDINTAILAFESGRVDWLSDVSAEYQADMLAERSAYEDRYSQQIRTMRTDGLTMDEALAALPAPERGERRNIHVFPTFGTDFYSFNCRPTLADGRPNPFADARVRRAFVMSVDKQTIVQRVTRLNEPVVNTFIPPGSIPGYSSPDGLPYDPQRARDELKAAGWIDRDGDGLVEDSKGESFPIVDLLYSTNTPRYKNISLALRNMWQQELGVRFELRGKERKFFKDDLIQGNFMIGRGGWYGDYGDPTTFLDVFKTGNGNNDRGYSSPYLDDLLDKATQETDTETRMELLQECERFLFAEEVPMLILCQYVQVYMYEPGRLTGLSQHPRLTQYLWQMKVNAP